MLLNENEKGATLLEVMGVMAVVGSIVVGLMGGISHMYQKMTLTRAHNQVTEIVKNMRAQFSSYIPSSVTANQLAALGVFNKDDVTDNKAYSVFGSEMTLTIQSHSDNPYFTFTYTNIPADSCMDLLTGDWGDDPSSGLRQISVSGTKKTTTYKWAKDLTRDEDGIAAANQGTLLPTQNDAFSACDQNGKESSLSWQYYL